MVEFMTHLWGQGETVEFTYFSLAHILPIAIMLAVIGLIIIFRKKLRNCKHEDKIRLTLGFILIITEMTYFWRLAGVESLNSSAVDHLPITVCGWAIIFSTFLVLTKNKTLYDIVYFWVFAGSTFGILTPTVITYCGPTRIRYYQFWLEHTLGFITIFYMTFVHGMRPNIKSMIKSYILLIILGVIAIITNLSIPGANYLFMAMPEEVPSILDILPKNYPLRITIMALAMALLFFITYLPWFIIDKKRKKSNPDLAVANVAKTNKKASKKRNDDDIIIEDFKTSKLREAKQPIKEKNQSRNNNEIKPTNAEASQSNQSKGNSKQIGNILSKIQTTKANQANNSNSIQDVPPKDDPIQTSDSAELNDQEINDVFTPKTDNKQSTNKANLSSLMAKISSTKPTNNMANTTQDISSKDIDQQSQYQEENIANVDNTETEK